MRKTTSMPFIATRARSRCTVDDGDSPRRWRPRSSRGGRRTLSSTTTSATIRARDGRRYGNRSARRPLCASTRLRDSLSIDESPVFIQARPVLCTCHQPRQHTGNSGVGPSSVTTSRRGRCCAPLSSWTRSPGGSESPTSGAIDQEFQLGRSPPPGPRTHNPTSFGREANRSARSGRY